MKIRTAASCVALACLAVAPVSFAAPASRRASELQMQAQDLRMRIRQEAAKSEAGLTAAQRSVLKDRVAQAAPEVSRVRADIRILAARLHVALSPGSAGALGVPNRDSVLSQLDQAAEDLLAVFMGLKVDDPKKEGDALDAIRAMVARLLNVHGRMILDLSPSATPHLSPRPSHDPRPDLVLDSVTPHTEGRIRIKMHNQGGPIRDVDLAASFIRVTVNDSIEKNTYFKDIDPNGLLKIGEMPAGSGINRILIEYIWPATGPNGITLAPGHTYKVKVVLDFEARILDGDRSNNAKTVHLTMTP
jgi:hypothetical protein